LTEFGRDGVSVFEKVCDELGEDGDASFEGGVFPRFLSGVGLGEKLKGFGLR
jgi:hypothetical protein